MRNNKEYKLSEAISTYLKLQYPKIIFHFDYAGLNLSKSQAGRMKAIQGERGFPDLIILEPKGVYHALFIELKASSIFKQDGTVKTDKHLFEQRDVLNKLTNKGYYCMFGIGLDNTIKIINEYMNLITECEHPYHSVIGDGGIQPTKCLKCNKIISSNN